MRKWLRGAAFVACVAGSIPLSVAAQVVRVGTPRPRPEDAVSSLSISAVPSSVSFQLVAGGTVQGSSAVAITTTWGGTLCLFTCTVNVYGYFSSPTAALVSTEGSPPVDIPSSEILGEVPTGIPTGYTAFTQTSPFGGAGAGLELVTQSFFILAGAGTRTDSLSLEIDLTNQPQLPAGTYSGTLYIQAQSL